MGTKRSDVFSNSTESHKNAVREYLRTHDEVAAKAEPHAETDVPAWYIDQIASTDSFYTSLITTVRTSPANTSSGSEPPTTVSGGPRTPTPMAFLYRDELLATFLSVAVAELQSIPPDSAAALVLRQFEGDSFEALEHRLRRNHSHREALEYTNPAAVPDGTSFWRSFDAVEPDDLRDCFQSMCEVLVEEREHGGEFVVIDGTHIAAWANTHQEIEDGEVEGASWGNHEGSFYGYKVFLVVDAALELPIESTMMTGKRNHSVAFERLVEKFEDRYGTDDLQAALADAGFEGQGIREFCQEHLDCPLLTAIGPPGSSPLQMNKQEFKEIFEEQAETIETPYDALELLPQQQLSAQGVEAGGVE